MTMLNWLCYELELSFETAIKKVLAWGFNLDDGPAAGSANYLTKDRKIVALQRLAGEIGAACSSDGVVPVMPLPPWALPTTR